MGTWSASITGNDTALDMIEEYKVAFSYFDVAAGLEKLDQYVRSRFDESDEDEWCAYFYSLADFMWKNGILTDEIRDKAIKMVDSDFGMDTWIDAGWEKKRRKELSKFREKITSPQCAPRKIKLSHIHPDDIFENGEVIAIQLKTAGKKLISDYCCDCISDKEFLSYDNKYVVIQKIYSKETHFCGIMPELCDRTAMFVLFKGIYDSPEDIDITKLEEADFKCGHSELVPYFEHESSMFQFKKRGYKVIGKMECRSIKETCQAHFLRLGDDLPYSNADSDLVTAVIDYDISLKEYKEELSEEELQDMVRAAVHWEHGTGYSLPTSQWADHKAKLEKIMKEKSAAYHDILNSGAKIYIINYAYPVGYAFKVAGRPAEILMNEEENKYLKTVEKYVHGQLDD